MKMKINDKTRAVILLMTTVLLVCFIFQMDPISQDPSYHHFADNRVMMAIPNFYNVISNLPFVLLGLTGLIFFFRDNTFSVYTLPVFTLFIGVTTIGLGSAYYHLYPNNATLVWDRIPMTITFMSFFSIIISTYINKLWGAILLTPLVILGIASVVIWYLGELNGAGDLRLYALVQFYPMIVIPLILFVYPTSRKIKLQVLSIIVTYGIAKIFEKYDVQVLEAGQLISGHSLKHLFAAISILLIVRLVRQQSGYELR